MCFMSTAVQFLIQFLIVVVDSAESIQLQKVFV